MNFGKAIRKYRNEANLKQRELATRLKVAPTYISQLETGAAEPSLGLIRSIAKVFNVPAELLFWEALDVPDSATDEEKKQCDVAKKLIENWSKVYAPCPTSKLTP